MDFPPGLGALAWASLAQQPPMGLPGPTPFSPMPGGKPQQTPEQRALRLRGYELFLTTDEQGRRRSLRSIAMALGVTLTTVTYWRKRDKWDQRLHHSMGLATAATQRSSGALGALLRNSLFEHISTLNEIIRDPGTKIERKLTAIKELGNLAHKLKAINPGDLVEEKPPQSFDFKDDLDDGKHDGHGADAAAADGPAPLPDDHDDVGLPADGASGGLPRGDGDAGNDGEPHP